MPLTINIELDDADLQHFRKLMRNAKQAATALEDDTIIAAAETLLTRVSKAKVPAFIREREAQRRGVPVDTMTREKWQQSKRTELITRIQRRRAAPRSGRQRSSFSLW